MAGVLWHSLAIPKQWINIVSHGPAVLAWLFLPAKRRKQRAAENLNPVGPPFAKAVDRW